MAMTIKLNKIWIKQANGTYTSFDAVSDKTTNDRINDINTAASEALNQIDSVKKLIPNDYTEMSSFFNTMKNEYVSITNSEIDSIVESI